MFGIIVLCKVDIYFPPCLGCPHCLSFCLFSGLFCQCVCLFVYVFVIVCTSVYLFLSHLTLSFLSRFLDLRLFPWFDDFLFFCLFLDLIFLDFGIVCDALWFDTRSSRVFIIVFEGTLFHSMLEFVKYGLDLKTRFTETDVNSIRHLLYEITLSF